MSPQKSHSGPIAVAKLDDIPENVATRAEEVSDAVDSDKEHFPNPVPMVAQTRTDTATLRALIKAAGNRTVGAADTRDHGMHIVKRDVGHLVDTVQEVADRLPPETAKVFIINMRLFVSDVGRRGPRAELRVDDGEVSGSVDLYAISQGRNTTYYFEFSLDQVTWTRAPDSHKSHIRVTGLTAGKLYYFRFRALVGDTMHDPSLIVPWVVK